MSSELATQLVACPAPFSHGEKRRQNMSYCRPGHQIGQHHFNIFSTSFTFIRD